MDVFVHIAAKFPDFTYGATVSIRMHPCQSITFYGDTGFLTLNCHFNANVHDIAELVLENDGQRVVTERWLAVKQYLLQVENLKAAAMGAAYPCPLSFSRGT